MTAFFQDLAWKLQTRWLATGYREASFPSVCAEVLLESEPARHLDMTSLLRWGLGADRLPLQIDADASFGEPPLTVFANERFHITLYFWLNGTPDIHDHGFSGAFTVLKGTSLHTTFRFDPRETVNDHLMLGTLTEHGVELVGRGDVREIQACGATIHSLYHLERPSLSMVVRTHRNVFSRPQYIYSRSGVAWNPSHDRLELKRRLQLMKFVRVVEPEELVDHAAKWLESTDAAAAFIGLRGLVASLPMAEGDELLARIETRLPMVTTLVRGVVENDRREMAITHPRATVSDPELRFFLAVLVNVHGRETALRVIQERFPDRDPVESIMVWVRALAQLPSPTGVGPSVLGFTLTEAVDTSLRSLLQGKDADAHRQDIEALAGRPLTSSEGHDLLRLRRVLQSSMMFRNLIGV